MYYLLTIEQFYFFTVFLFDMIYTPLKFPPAKLTSFQMPEFLFYHYKPYKILKKERYLLYSIKDKQVKAYMDCIPKKIWRDGKFKVPSLRIDFFQSLDRDKGFGTMLMDFAKILSKSLGCKGNIHLKASAALDPQRAPHLFYRKNGFNTGLHSIDNKIDKFIKNGEDASWMYLMENRMFFPPVKYFNEQKQGKKLIDLFIKWLVN